MEAEGASWTIRIVMLCVLQEAALGEGKNVGFGLG